MTERQPQVLDIEEVIRSKAGNKARFIPKFLVNWFKKFMQLDPMAREFVLGYVSGKRDEQQAGK